MIDGHDQHPRQSHADGAAEAEAGQAARATEEVGEPGERDAVGRIATSWLENPSTLTIANAEAQATMAPTRAA
ncbi:MAG: hypothetical protein M3123_00350 [Actinomycetota bacterium]|nr:hypothetical protein [Actinomycetota bacterium]